MNFDTWNRQIVEHNLENTWGGHFKRKSMAPCSIIYIYNAQDLRANFWYQCTSCHNEHQTKQSTNEMEHPLIAAIEFN